MTKLGSRLPKGNKQVWWCWHQCGLQHSRDRSKIPSIQKPTLYVFSIDWIFSDNAVSLQISFSLNFVLREVHRFASPCEDFSMYEGEPTASPETTLRGCVWEILSDGLNGWVKMQPKSNREGPPANHLVQSPVSRRHTSNVRTSQVSKTSMNGNSPASLDNQHQHFDTLLVKTFQQSVPSLTIWHYGEEFGSAPLSLPSCRMLLLPLSVPYLLV